MEGNADGNDIGIGISHKIKNGNGSKWE